MHATRPTIHGSRHAVSSAHYLATGAGFAILEAGGNAVDAGCAAGIVLGVVETDIVGFGGVAPIMIRTADGQVETIAGLGHWPRALPADLFLREHGGRIPAGVLRTVVPAAPDAWITALARHGTMSFGDVAAAALHFARDGFTVQQPFADTVRAHAAAYARWPENAALFLPGGAPIAPGAQFVQADLARSIAYMIDQERAAAGAGRAAGLEAARAAFYRGDIAREIVAHQAREGGYLSMDDLARFRSHLEPAIIRDWRGHQVMTCGPWCQGPALLEALLLLEHVGLDGLAHNSTDYLHLLVECLKIAMADREYLFGDPRFVDVPLDWLLSPDTIARRATQIDPARAAPDMPPPLAGAPRALAPTEAAMPRSHGDTSYVCVVDRWGNSFSATPSDGSWDVPIVPGLGFVCSGRGSQSRPDPAHPSGVAPGKRPRLTPNPAMVVTSDGGVMPFGSPGGDMQVQAMLQVLLNILHFGMDVQDAIEAPRVGGFSFPSSFAPFEYFPARLHVESRIDQPTRDALAQRGHDIKDWPSHTRAAGTVEAIRRSPTGHLAAGADIRRLAAAMAS